MLCVRGFLCACVFVWSVCLCNCAFVCLCVCAFESLFVC